MLEFVDHRPDDQVAGSDGISGAQSRRVTRNRLRRPQVLRDNEIDGARERHQAGPWGLPAPLSRWDALGLLGSTFLCGLQGLKQAISALNKGLTINE